ncbi:unnamed protein product [Orchesella dallaii]|uniref:Methyl farnesoate epoxidase n=1 Tax=Orchesella dallaii TaxID=48710 RepID=A0ABP1QN96_9HEXA
MYVYLVLPVVLLLLLVYYVYSIQMSTRNMPPGPFVVPFGLGSIPEVWLRRPIFKFWQVRPWEYLAMLSKTYGDLIGFNVLGFDAIAITSYELMTEVANMEEYSIKFAHELYTYPRTFGKEMGLIFAASPPLWTEMRKFTVRTLREFGFGKVYTMHSVIIAEVNLLADDFKKKIKSDYGVVKFRNTFSLTVLNVLWCMVAGIRYEHDDPRLLKLMGHVFNMSKSVTFGNPLELILPVTKKIAPWLHKANLRNKVFDSCHELSKTLIEERKAEGYYLSEPQNYMDVFLKKIHEHRDQKDTIYTEQQLQSMVADLLMVGSLTLNATLNYGILFLTLNPEIQKKCQDEIDAIVPRNIAPTVDDVEKMPYFQAFMLETHRCANVVPNPVPRMVPKDWHLRGYVIPKNTVILSNHYSVNTDEKIWGDPLVFRPGRFINEKGEFVPDPRVVIFGFGK